MTDPTNNPERTVEENKAEVVTAFKGFDANFR